MGQLDWRGNYQTGGKLQHSTHICQIFAILAVLETPITIIKTLFIKTVICFTNDSVLWMSQAFLLDRIGILLSVVPTDNYI